MKYNVYTDKDINDIKITLISDLHYTDKTSLKKMKKIIDKVVLTKPDYIVFPGDLLDEGKDINDNLLIDLIINLSKIAKVIFSLGNHDLMQLENGHWASHKNETTFNKIQMLNNVEVLDNTSIELDNVRFTGFTVPFGSYEEDRGFNYFKTAINKEFIKPLDNNLYNILLCHTPVHVINEKNYRINIMKNMDLVLSGHMHGGLVHPLMEPFLPKHIGLISPEKELLPKNVRGYIVSNGTHFIISKGLTTFSQTAGIFKHFDGLYPMNIDEITISKQLKKEY